MQALVTRAKAGLRAWRDLASLREPEKFPAWLYRIAQNLAKNYLTRQRRPVASLEQMEWAAEREAIAPPDAAAAMGRGRSKRAGGSSHLAVTNRLPSYRMLGACVS